MQRPRSSRLAWLRELTATPGRTAACLAVLVLAAALGHMIYAVPYHGPWVFDDELGYQKLAQSLGTAHRLALFEKQGLSYSPLYPLVLAPFYAFHLSGPDAYLWTKILNCFLLALAAIPVYAIARYALTPGRALVAATLSTALPLMLYSALEMSENLAYPLALLTFWAILGSLRSPRWSRDALVIALCLVAAAARIQLAALLPAAFSAAVLDGLLAPGPAWGGVRRALKSHLLLTLATAGMAAAAVAALAGTEVLSVTGRYSNQRSVPFPPAWLLTRLLAQHAAGLVFAAAVLPFVGTLVAAYLYVKSRRARPVTAFAAMSIAVTTFLTGLAAYASYGQSYAPGATDLKRIHERYFMYVLPLLVIAMVATTALPRSERMRRVALAAAGIAAAVVLVIPFGTIINNGVAPDTFGLAPFAHSMLRGGVDAWPHATLIAIAYVLGLGTMYALARPNLVLLTALTMVIFVLVTLFEVRLLDAGATSATGQTMPVNRNWVDSAVRGGPVVALQIPHRSLRRDLATAETAFFNLSISRLYYVCDRLLAPDFGEIPVTVDARGRVRTPEGARVRARYVVGPLGRGVAGRVVAVNRPGHLELLRPPGGVVRVSSTAARLWACPGRRAGAR
jgi:hypothetical protein